MSGYYISISAKILEGKIKLIGSTNLPKDTILGIHNITRKNFSSDKEEVIIDKSGCFETNGSKFDKESRFAITIGSGTKEEYCFADMEVLSEDSISNSEANYSEEYKFYLRKAGKEESGGIFMVSFTEELINE